MSRPVRAFVGLGSNLDRPLEQVRAAVTALSTLRATRVVKASSFYRSPPMGPQDQPYFVNAVAVIDTGLSARALLEQLQALEVRAGRERGRRWGERVLDLDLLLYGAQQSTDPVLRLPHPGIARRAFVLVPLQEVAPRLAIPGLGPVSTLRAAVDCSRLQVLRNGRWRRLSPAVGGQTIQAVDKIQVRPPRRQP
ncbi:MAG: 2-amino-4-hydroxy-6-hydroxymethyldihydropteridine diphosphokinase [Pseudomonadota bacterium]